MHISDTGTPLSDSLATETRGIVHLYAEQRPYVGVLWTMKSLWSSEERKTLSLYAELL